MSTCLDSPPTLRRVRVHLHTQISKVELQSLRPFQYVGSLEMGCGRRHVQVDGGEGKGGGKGQEWLILEGCGVDQGGQGRAGAQLAWEIKLGREAGSWRRPAMG